MQRRDTTVGKRLQQTEKTELKKLAQPLKNDVTATPGNQTSRNRTSPPIGSPLNNKVSDLKAPGKHQDSKLCTGRAPLTSADR